MGKKPADRLDELDGRAIGDVLLDAHLSYCKPLEPLLEADLVHGLAHLTGGGFYDNIPRVLPEGLDVVVKSGAWPVLPVFEVIAREGDVSFEEMHRVFNMGIGMVVFVAPSDLARVGRDLEGRGPALVRDRQREAGQPPRRRRAAARVMSGGAAPISENPEVPARDPPVGPRLQLRSDRRRRRQSAPFRARRSSPCSRTSRRPRVSPRAAARPPALAVDRKSYPDRRAHEAEMLRQLDLARPDLVCLAGYMRLLSPGFVGRWRGRILNIHPALLPKFPGLDVQRRALEAGETESGCTVHFVDEGTDTGPIVLQRRVPILPGDTEESLSARILEQEHRGLSGGDRAGPRDAFAAVKSAPDSAAQATKQPDFTGLSRFFRNRLTGA